MLPLDATALTLFLVSAFVGGITTGLAGFAMGLVVSGVWLHILTPTQTAVLIVIYGLLVQGHGVWKFRRAVNLRRVVPLVVGGAFGVPIGVWLLAHLEPAYVRHAVGALLVLYSLYGMFQPNLAPFRAAVPADTLVGFANGVLGGLTGLTGPIVVIWCQLTGVPRDMQRAIFQPVIFAAFVVAIDRPRDWRRHHQGRADAVCARCRADCRRNLGRRASLRPAGRSRLSPRDPLAAVALRPRAAGAGLVRNWHSSARDVQAKDLQAKDLRGRPPIRYGRRARA